MLERVPRADKKNRVSDYYYTDPWKQKTAG